VTRFRQGRGFWASRLSSAIAPLFLLSGSLHAGDNSATARLIPSPEPGWPQFRGPRRDGICEEKGLLKSWPATGPKLLWQTSGLGHGYSGPIITHDRIYLAGETNKELRILSLDLGGRKIWESPNGRAWDGPYSGARASCTFSEGRIYHQNSHGRVGCFDAATGKELWAVNVLDRFGGKVPTWGIGENLLVDGKAVIVTAGGTRALMAGLDKKSGATIWNTEPLRLGIAPSEAHERLDRPEGGIDNCGYSSPLLFSFGKRRMIVSCSQRHAFGVDAETGQLLWTRPFPTRYLVIALTPALVGDAVFVTAPDTEEGGKLFQIKEQDGIISVQTVWTTPLDTCHGGVISIGDALYGSFYRQSKGWACVDVRTGGVRYQMKDMEMGSLLWADEQLYSLSQDGEIALLQPTADRFEVAGRFKLVPGRKNDVWTHPVILDHKLYLRYHDDLFCYDIEAK
jgi:outer membrane protein assembly factor BamB